MNDLVLSERLRALREPAPVNDFEQRLGQALWREAQVLRAAHGSERAGLRARLRRLAGRAGLTLTLALGATAAAAAGGGAWVYFASSQAPAPAAAVSSAAPEPSASARRSEAQELRAPPPEEPASVAAEPAPVLATPALPALPALPARTARQHGSRPAGTSKPMAPRVESSLRSAPAPAPLQPFELPSRAVFGAATSGAQDPPAALAQPDRRERGATSARRQLPDLPARADRRRTRAERPDRGQWPPGRANALEHSGRDNAERGLERARQAHERK